MDPHTDKAKRYLKKLGSALFKVLILSESYGTRRASLEVSKAGVVIAFQEPLNGVRVLYDESFETAPISIMIHPRSDKLVMIKFSAGRQLAFATQSPYESNLLVWCLEYFQYEA
ncbi:uncharacterized protein AMSG_09061 [Thecamonas trahens ATCC 50062]|uniref:Uncharacterized protein n=1 Tax=Thecamonas trahens ATCC 50062 TaxID=461836 RepID=A0A0L0DNA8_THETB|nr:hypothetical protein AMSG_09061 [Thecamonas trahens ATCC 50062]KNC52898.1 hypothetical protein AMSG_09061 [Thecamonas trahens ATCC 50062]|eukprot:XP_013754993.1 hypothetical protein AMSG_09061 [Thecamonas trahens ATCC 50062]